MLFHLVFCADGVLRIEFVGKPLMPAHFIQKEAAQTDFEFWTAWWHQPVIFEQGLNIGGFFACLEPWVDFWSSLIRKDIAAFISESKKPGLVGEIDWITLGVQSLLTPDKSQWQINRAYHLNGYKKDVADFFSVENMEMNRIAHVPLFLLSQETLTMTEPVFSSQAQRINTVDGLHYLEGLGIHTLRDVIEGFFYGFSATPHIRDETIDSVREAVAQSCHTTSKSLESNVVSLFPQSSSCEDILQDIVVVPGAFDDVIEDFDRQNDYWKKLMEQAKKNKIIFKIGSIKPTQPPQKRLYSYILPT